MEHSKEYYINQKIKELKDLLKEKDQEDLINFKSDQEKIFEIRRKYFDKWKISLIEENEILKIKDVNIRIILKYINQQVLELNKTNKEYELLNNTFKETHETLKEYFNKQF